MFYPNLPSPFPALLANNLPLALAYLPASVFTTVFDFSSRKSPLRWRAGVAAPGRAASSFSKIPPKTASQPRLIAASQPRSIAASQLCSLGASRPRRRLHALDLAPSPSPSRRRRRRLIRAESSTHCPSVPRDLVPSSSRRGRRPRALALVPSPTQTPCRVVIRLPFSSP